MASPLWRDPDFMKLWVGQTVSEVGSYITSEGLPLTALLLLSATPAQMGILSALASLPILLFSLLAGVWIDRVRRRPLMIGADIGRGVILLMLPLAAFTGHLTFELLCLVAVLVGVLSMLFNTARHATLPSLVSREYLLDANTKLAITNSLDEIIGPTLAGFLIQVLTAPIAIVLDALSFWVSAVCLIFIRKPEPAPLPTVDGQSVRKDIVEGLRVLWRQPILRTLVIAASAKSFFGSFYAVLYSVFVIRELGFTPLVLGILVGLGGVGALMGAFIAARVGYRLMPVLGVMLFTEVLTLTFLLSGNVGFILLVLGFTQLVGDTAGSIYAIYETSLRQMLVPDHLLGRTNATTSFLTLGMMPIGAIIAGLLASVIGVRETLWLSTVGFLFTTLWLMFSPLRTVKEIAAVEA